MCFHIEQANKGKIRDDFFLNKTIPLWNDLPVKVKKSKINKWFRDCFGWAGAGEWEKTTNITSK